MSSISLKFLKSLIAVLCLSMIAWSSVSAQSLILCVSDKGHAEIESALDSCCIKPQPLNTIGVSMQAVELSACGNCTDTPLSFYFHQSSSGHDLKMPAISSNAAQLILPTESNLDFSYKYQLSNSHLTPSFAVHSHLDIQKVTVLLV